MAVTGTSRRARDLRPAAGRGAADRCPLFRIIGRPAGAVFDMTSIAEALVTKNLVIINGAAKTASASWVLIRDAGDADGLNSAMMLGVPRSFAGYTPDQRRHRPCRQAAPRQPLRRRGPAGAMRLS
jgi:hypothetical protein